MTLYRGMPVIDESNYQQHVTAPPGMSRGLVPRDFMKIPYGSSPAAPASAIQKIPRSDWSAMIKERTERRLTNMDFIASKGVKVKDQNGTNYCWVFAVIFAIQLARLRAGFKHLELSPASLGALIKNFQNVGGWGLQAVEGSIKYGIAPSNMWADTYYQDRKYDTEAVRKIRTNYMTSEFFDIRPGDFDMMATYLLLGFPVPVGHNWWGHEVCHVELVEIEPGHFGTIFANSWGISYGTNGYGVMAQSKATPDDAQAVMGVKLAA